MEHGEETIHGVQFREFRVGWVSRDESWLVRGYCSTKVTSQWKWNYKCNCCVGRWRSDNLGPIRPFLRNSFRNRYELLLRNHQSSWWMDVFVRSGKIWNRVNIARYMHLILIKGRQKAFFQLPCPLECNEVRLRLFCLSACLDALIYMPSTWIIDCRQASYGFNMNDAFTPL